MHPLLLRLAADGSPGPLGDAHAVAEEIGEAPDLLAVVLDGLSENHPGLRNRCAIALDRATASHARGLVAHTDVLLALADLAERWLRREPPAVRANALDALMSVAVQHPTFVPRVRAAVEAALDHRAPSVRARARHHAVRLDRWTGAEDDG